MSDKCLVRIYNRRLGRWFEETTLFRDAHGEPSVVVFQILDWLQSYLNDLDIEPNSGEVGLHLMVCSSESGISNFEFDSCKTSKTADFVYDLFVTNDRTTLVFEDTEKVERRIEVDSANAGCGASSPTVLQVASDETQSENRIPESGACV